MCPQPPKLSPEYSHKAGLQTVITGMPLQIRPVTRGGHAGPVIMGRITRGPLSWTRPHGGMTPSQAFVWCRIKRRVSLLVLSPSDRRLQRGHRAKGGVFAFAPTTTKVAIGEAAVDGRTGQSSAPPDTHCSVSGAPPRHPTVRVLEKLTVGAFVFLWHRIVWWCTEQSGAPLTRCSDICRDTVALPESTIAHR
jgi:hypothetical protein